MISLSITEICDIAPSGDSYHGRVRSSDQLQQPQEICDLAPSGDSYQDETDCRISSKRLKKIYNIVVDIYSVLA
jgi:hypothetical protein